MQVSLPVIAALLSSILALAAAQSVVFGVGRCPKVSTKENFELEKYYGLWFSYENFPTTFQEDMDCVRASYSPSDTEGVVRVVNTGKKRDFRDGRYFVTSNERAIGSATVVDRDMPSGLRVKFGSVPDFLLGSGPNYNILDTDYDNYSVVYSCQQILFFKIESAWILTRTTEQPDNIQTIKDQMRSYGIDVSHFEKINHDQC